MNVILAVDTSGPVAGVCVTAGGEVRYEAAAVNKLTHSVNLMPMIAEALLRAGVRKEELTHLAVVTGPGSFTGVRIGVSAVKGMAHGLNVPCVGVDALEALAAGLPFADGLICPMLDARAGQVYAAAFLRGTPPERRLPDQAMPLAAFLDAAEAEAARAGAARLVFLGDGVARLGDAVRARLSERAVFAPMSARYLRPACVAALAEARVGEAIGYRTLMPAYLRAPQAERERERAEEAIRRAGAEQAAGRAGAGEPAARG